MTTFTGRGSHSSDGCSAIIAAVDEAVPAPVLSTAVCEHFGSGGAADFADKVLSALWCAFGSHEDKAAVKKGNIE